jgi:tetratricopeptide (TPR) repeat protein
MLYAYEGNYQQAESQLVKLVETARRSLGEDNPNTLNAMNDLALTYRYEAKYSQAEPLYLKLLDLQQRVFGAAHPRRFATLNDLALLYLNEGNSTRAEALLRQALAAHEKGKMDTWLRYNCESLLGASLAGQKKYAQAEPLLLSGYNGMVQRISTIPAASRFSVEQAGKHIVKLYQEWGKQEEAAEWRQKIQVTKSTARSEG